MIRRASLLPLLPMLGRLAPARPNLVFVVADQHNARALSCYGHPVVRTPSIDRLAEGGVRFANAFCTTPQCDPARLSIQTGLYARTHGVVLNRVPYTGDDEFLPQAFRDAGYATACIGKRPLVADADRFGFQQWESFNRYKRQNGRRAWSPQKERLPIDLHGPVGTSPLPNEEHPAGYWTARAIDFVRAKKSEPFLLWLSFYGPHTPIVPSRPFADWYDPDELELPPNFATEGGPPALQALRKEQSDITPELHRSILAAYYGLVSQIDHNVGLLLDALDELDLARNTIVVYVSDHGELMAEHGVWTKGALLYDALVRVPLVVRWPERLESGRVETSLVSTIDLKPGLTGLAGIPSRPGARPPEGRDLFAEAPPRERVFAEFGDPAADDWHCRMVRTATHKYVVHTTPKGRPEELFDLARDPWERDNRIGEGGETLAALRRELAAWEERVPYTRTTPVARPDAPRRRRDRKDR